jgi:hypothetical protein
MNDPQPISPRRRLQELLDIPERLRTDEQWDEINELEISLNPINRITAAEQHGRVGAGPGPGPMPAAKAKPGAGKRKKLHKKLFRIPPKDGKQ